MNVRTVIILIFTLFSLVAVGCADKPLPPKIKTVVVKKRVYVKSKCPTVDADSIPTHTITDHRDINSTHVVLSKVQFEKNQMLCKKLRTIVNHLGGE